MELTFLSGPIPLTKTITYSKRDEHYTIAPYPLIQRVTSNVLAVRTISEFASALKVQGAAGACLLKGALDQPLQRESRAGHSIDAPHEWIVFDFDKVDCEPSFDGALAAIAKYLPPECAHTDCVVQLSSSVALPTARHLSAHVFMLLDTPQDTRTLNDWLTSINFHSPLKDEMALTDSGMGLHFPLDRTVVSPAKLIYIAPPRCVGFAPETIDTIRTYSGKHRALKLPAFQPTSNDIVASKLNELRVAAGMEERPYRTRTAKDMEILIDAEECVVHDVKASGDGYVRFNLNGGDSLAYYVNLREPGIIGNFKGEPYLMTAQVAPDFFKALTKAAKSLPTKMPSAAVEPLAFYATNRQSTIYIGSYDREHDRLRVDPSTLTAAYSWLYNFGVPIKQALPHYDLVHDMDSDIRFEDGYPIINLYERTEFLKQFADLPRTIPCDEESLKRLQAGTPTIWRVIFSAVGSSTPAAFYFINWLAAIFQRRQRTMSAWVLHGEQGTGKGMLVDKVLRPLFGNDALTQQLYNKINTDHNAFLEGRLFVVINEADLSRAMDQSSIRSKLYDWITEPFVSINPKGKDERDVPNHANFLLTSNSKRPVMIEEGDRRFNVGEKQEQRLFINPNEWASLCEGTELEALSRVLGAWQVNDDMLIKPYGGEAKERIYEATHSLLDRIARAINDGDALFFFDNRPDAAQLRTDFNGKMLPIREYDALLTAMAEGTLNVLTASDLYVLFRMVAVTDRTFPEVRAEQRRIYQRYGLLDEKGKTHKDRRTGKTARGFPVPRWKVDAALRKEILSNNEEREGNVVALRGKR